MPGRHRWGSRALLPGRYRRRRWAPGAGSASGESVGSGAGSASADRPGAGAGPESAVVAGGVAEAVAGLAGEVPAARFLGALADRIAVGAASVVAVLDPRLCGARRGGGAGGGTVLAGLVEERLRRMSPLVTEVRASSLGGTAVLRGALLTARDRAQDELFAPPERLGG